MNRTIKVDKNSVVAYKCATTSYFNYCAVVLSCYIVSMILS